MQHLAAGHDDALAVLFDRYNRLVLSVVLRVLHDTGEAQDITQEVFLHLYRTVERFDSSKGTTRLWILRAAYQRSINRRQYLKIRNFYDSEMVTEEPEGGIIESKLLPPEARRLVKQVLGQLGEVQRRTIELAYFEGLSMEEIAQKTGESVNNVRHHYYRGLSKLKCLLLDDSSSRVLESRAKEAANARA